MKKNFMLLNEKFQCTSILLANAHVILSGEIQSSELLAKAAIDFNIMHFLNE